MDDIPRPKLYLQLRSVSPHQYKITTSALPTPCTSPPPANIPTMAENDRTNIPPVPAYFPTSADSPLYPPTALYTTLRNLPSSSLVKTQDFTIPPRSGKAWTVPAGALFRLSTPEGAQVGDLNVWNQHDPRERFWASRTRQLQGSHVVQGDRLWSCLPFMRPLCGLVEDGCEIRDSGGKGIGKGREENRDERGGVTRWGGRCNDLLGTRCDPYGMFERAGLQWVVLPDPLSSFSGNYAIGTIMCTRDGFANGSHSIKHANILILRLPLPLEPRPFYPSIWADRIRCPRRTQRIPGHWSRFARPLFHGS